MATYYYIDTCSLKWRYLSGFPTPYVDTLLSDSRKAIFTAEFTILEWSSALGVALRDQAIDEEAFKRNEIALMADIASERLKIIRWGNRTIERGRYLIQYLGIELRRSLKTGDAIHLVHALDLSRQTPPKLLFVTSDKRLANIIASTDFLAENLDSLYLDPEPPTTV
jgi:hypothetical protein